jgi:hypothetical protein
MSREIRRENLSLLRQRRKTVSASTHGKNVRIGSLQLIVHQDSAVRFHFQSGLQRQLDIRSEVHRDHYQISRRFFTVFEAHGFHSPIAKHGFDLGNRDIAAALSQPAPGFRRQPIANHDGSGPFIGCVDNSPGVIQRAEDKHAVFVQAVHGGNNGARSGCQNQFVVARPIPIAAAHSAAQSIDLLDPNSQSRPDPVLLIPLDVIQRDAADVALAGEQTGQQRAVIVGVGFIAKNGNVEDLTVLEKFFHAGYGGHPVAREHYMLALVFVHAW